MSDCSTHPLGLTHSNGSSERPHGKCNDDMSLLPASLKLSFGIALRINLTLQSHFIIDIIQHLSSWISNFLIRVAAAAKSLQSCPTLCDPIDGSPTGSHRPWDFPGKNTGVGCHFLLQCMKVKSESEVTQSLSDPWTAAYQAPPSMGFSRQEYWCGVPSPSPMVFLVCL